MPAADPGSRADARRFALVVFDFDGTLTDVDSHASDFFSASAHELALRMSWDDAMLEREWAQALEEVMQLPPETAWKVDGHDACPATADPYMIANSVTHRLLCEHRPAEEARSRLSTVLEVHHAAYQRVTPPFRPDTRPVLEQLLSEGYPVRVVSNSRTAAIERMLDSLKLSQRDRLVVCGDAGKFSVCGATIPDARFDALPVTFDGWQGGRPIHLRRGRYFDVLRSIWDATGTTPHETLVIGDIFELDLAMPLALGTHIHFVTRAGTLPHELRLAQAAPRSVTSASLAAVLKRFTR